MKTQDTVTVDLPKEYHELIKRWQMQEYSPLSADKSQCIYSGLAISPLLQRLPCVTYILDVRSQRVEFISKNAQDIFGYDPRAFTDKGLQLFNDLKHPEDRQNYWKLLYKVWDHLMLLHPASRFSYSFCCEYRITKPNCVEGLILEQSAILQQDSSGNITHLVSVCMDIVGRKASHDSFVTVYSQLDHSVLYFTEENEKTVGVRTVLSKREIEIVRLLAQGFSSKYIAAVLGISVHTVNTHRQHMIEKTKSKNTGEVIQFAYLKRLI